MKPASEGVGQKRTRRRFLQAAGTLGAAALAAVEGIGAAPGAAAPSRGLPGNWRRLRKLDAHHHVFSALPPPGADWPEVDALVEAAAVLGIERVCCSRPIIAGVRVDIEAVRAANDIVLAAARRHPGRLLGYCFVQPGNGRAALDEIDRCLEAGMIGVKLYNQYRFSDPVVYPVAEHCLARRIPILGHSAFLTDPKARAQQPHASHALDFCALARRYPDLMLVLGHVNGGGDWEWAIKGLRECPQVYLDTSGSVQEDDTIGRCVRELGHRRVLFATDGVMEGGVGKILSADLTPAQREDVFHGNFQRILDRRRA